MPTDGHRSTEMKPWQMGAALILSSGALAGGAVRVPARHERVMAAAPATTAPVWLSDIEAARATSVRTGKPLFVAFR